ncbi:MAG: carboxypeptidase-like regulatory domain-containing protein [Calditrichaeota bacterium]|nr:carboxypeptidase-like regulatory domain-containing protein [Calditrichota bacterium]
MKCLLFMTLVISSLISQYDYKGKVIDSETGEALIGVNIQVKGTYEGTATDLNGEFIISTAKQNPLLLFTYVGYEDIEINAANSRLIRMNAITFSSAAIYVYAEQYTLAQRIVLNTMANYNEKAEELDNFQLNSYAKQFFQFQRTKKDSLFEDSLKQIGDEEKLKERERRYYPWVFESYKEIQWKSPNKLNQTILKRNQGKAIPAMFNLLGTIKFENIFNERIGDFKSPLYRPHFEEFDYSYHGKQKLNNDSVYVIQAALTDTADQLTFKLLIEDQDYLLKRVEILSKPNTNRVFSPTPFIRMNSKNLSIIQSYYEINGISFPKDYVISRINERGVIRLSEIYTDYKINRLEQDHKFNKEFFNLDDDVDEIEDSTWISLRTEPLAPLEKRAYAYSDTIYNQYTPFQRFMFDHGFKFMFFDYKLFGNRLSTASDIYRYNPVEGHFLGLGFDKKQLGSLDYRFSVGYAINQKKVNGFLDLNFPVWPDMDLTLSVKPYHLVNSIDKQNVNSDFVTTLDALFSHENEHNYFLEKGVEIRLNKIITNHLNYTFIYDYKDASSLNNSSDFSLFYPSNRYRTNLSIQTHKERELGFQFRYSEYDIFNLGAFSFNNRLENGWDFLLDLRFDANDMKNASFKKVSGFISKRYDLSRNYELNFDSYFHYVGKAVRLQNSYFPEVLENYDNNNNYAIASLRKYEFTAFDYVTLGSYLKIRRPFDMLGFRDVFLNAMLYYADNYNTSSLGSVQLLPKGTYSVYGLSIDNDLLFVPLTFHLKYDTRIKSTFYKVRFEFRFN